MSNGLKGKDALVTDGSRSFGAAIAEALPAEGADVAISYVASAELARVLIADGRLGEAETLLRNAIRAVAFEPKIYLTLVDVVGRQQERWATCLADIEQALERSPLHIELTLSRMHSLYRLNRIEAARLCGNELASAHTNDASILVRIAKTAEKAGDFTTACGHYAVAVTLDPQRVPALLSVGRSMVRKGYLEEAEAAIRTALANGADEAKGLAALAEIERRRGNGGRAVALVAEALAIEQDNGGLRLTLAQDLYRLDRFAEAEEYLLPLLERNPALPALLCAARIVEAQGRNDDALKYLEIAAAENPEDKKAVLALAAAHFRFGRPKDAEAALRSAVEQHPGWVVARVQLAKFLSDVGRFDDSNMVIDEVLLRHPLEAEAWIIRSFNAGRSESARRAEEFLLAARPMLEENSRITISQCELAFSRGLDEVGEGLLREAEQRFPNDSRVRQFKVQRAVAIGQFDFVGAVLDSGQLPAAEEAYWRAQIHAAHLRFPEAELDYRSALAARPVYKAAIAGLIRALVAQLNIDEARENISRLNKMNIGVMTARQQSLNPSQSFFGELCNDIWSDSEAMAEVHSASQSGGIDALLGAVKVFTEYTGAAIALMIGLRRRGMLSDSVTPRDSLGDVFHGVRSEIIPRQCFQFWDSDELPEDILDLTVSWKHMNQYWDYKLFNMRSAEDFMNQNASADVRKAFRLAGHVAQKADIFRLAVLLREGGVYADADDRCLANLDPLVRGRDIVLRHENLGSIGNNFIAVRPGHPVIEIALEGAVRAVLRGDSESIWLSTGPGLLTRALAAHLASAPTQLFALRRESGVLLDWELRPFLASACRASYKSTARHWSVREFTKTG